MPTLRTYHVHTCIEWDTTKAVYNLRKHGIDFPTAVAALGDDRAITVEDEQDGEPRFVTVGMDSRARVLVVVYTIRGDTIRIISARKAMQRERGQYVG